MQGSPGKCSGCSIQSSTQLKGKFYISEGPSGSDELPEYGTLKNPAVSCFDLSMEIKIKESELNLNCMPNYAHRYLASLY